MQAIPEEWQLQPVNFLGQSSEQTQIVSQRIFEAVQGQSPRQGPSCEHYEMSVIWAWGAGSNLLGLLEYVPGADELWSSPANRS